MRLRICVKWNGHIFSLYVFVLSGMQLFCKILHVAQKNNSHVDICSSLTMLTAFRRRVLKQYCKNTTNVILLDVNQWEREEKKLFLEFCNGKPEPPTPPYIKVSAPVPTFTRSIIDTNSSFITNYHASETSKGLLSVRFPICHLISEQ